MTKRCVCCDTPIYIYSEHPGPWASWALYSGDILCEECAQTAGEAVAYSPEGRLRLIRYHGWKFVSLFNVFVECACVPATQQERKKL